MTGSLFDELELSTPIGLMMFSRVMAAS